MVTSRLNFSNWHFLILFRPRKPTSFRISANLLLWPWWYLIIEACKIWRLKILSSNCTVSHKKSAYIMIRSRHCSGTANGTWVGAIHHRFSLLSLEDRRIHLPRTNHKCAEVTWTVLRIFILVGQCLVTSQTMIGSYHWPNGILGPSINPYWPEVLHHVQSRTTFILCHALNARASKPCLLPLLQPE